MHMPSFWGLIIVLGLAFLLFGRPGRLSSTMEDLGKGIRGFRKGLSDPDTTTTPAQPAPPPPQVADQTQSSDRTNS